MEDAAERNADNESEEDDDEEEAVDMEAFEESGMLETDQVLDHFTKFISCISV